MAYLTPSQLYIWNKKLNKQRPGDQGLTDLGDGLRVSKDHVQIAAFGAIDELNCVIGLLITVKDLPEPMAHLLTRVQQELIQISNDISQSTLSIHDLHIQWLDKEIQEREQLLPPLKNSFSPAEQLLQHTHIWRARFVAVPNEH